VKILLPTVYEAIGGSTRVLEAARQALADDHVVVVRGPLAEASEQLRFSFPSRTLASFSDKLRAVPLLVTMAARETASLRRRGFDIIYVHDEPSLYVYGLAARAVGATVVRHVHMRGDGWLELIRGRLAHHAIYISEHARAAADGALIRNPVETFDIERAPLPGEIVVAGSICRRKNQILAIETLAFLRERGFQGSLRLCGNVIEPDYAAEVRGRAEELGVALLVRFEGMLPPRDYLSTASVLMMPSLYENQPLSLLEAIAVEVPVVAADIAANRELVQLGCLDPKSVQPLDAQSFAAAIADVAYPRPEYAERVRSVFSAERFGRELRTYFDAVGLRRAARAK
jgi:glycosyltransferase involved in cell wall biosynthesis